MSTFTAFILVFKELAQFFGIFTGVMFFLALMMSFNSSGAAIGVIILWAAICTFNFAYFIKLQKESV